MPDLGSSGNAGILYNNAKVSVGGGIKGNGARIKNMTSYLTIGQNGIAINGTAGWSFSLWVKGVRTSGIRTLLDNQAGLSLITLIDMTIGSAFVTGQSYDFYTFGASITDPSSWLLITVTHAGGVSNLYLNGTLAGNVTVPSPTENTYVGNGGYLDEKFADYIDEFRLYQRALTSQDVASLYDNVFCYPLSTPNPNTVRPPRG